MKHRVRIEGGGVAAMAAVALLRRGGEEGVLVAGPRQRPPVVVLDETTVHLLRRVTGLGADLFAGGHQLRRRIVCWGRDRPAVVTQAALTLDGSVLARRLRRAVAPYDAGDARHGATEGDEPTDWRLMAGQVPRNEAVEVCGRRVMVVTRVMLQDGVDRGACWIESTPRGWLFLAPLGGRRALLQASLPGHPEEAAEALAEVLDRARHISRLVDRVDSTARVFPTSPRFLDPPCGAGWLAIGSAAMKLDPLCGDGVGAAVRSAILAVGLIRGQGGEFTEREGRAHYRHRLRRNFVAHLAACRRFYGTGGFDGTWHDEIAAIDGALVLHQDRLPTGEPQLAIRGWDLGRAASGP